MNFTQEYDDIAYNHNKTISRWRRKIINQIKKYVEYYQKTGGILLDQENILKVTADFKVHILIDSPGTTEVTEVKEISKVSDNNLLMLEKLLRINFLHVIREEQIKAFEEVVDASEAYEIVRLIKSDNAYLVFVEDGIITRDIGTTRVHDHYKSICPFVLLEVIHEVETNSEYI